MVQQLGLSVPFVAAGPTRTNLSTNPSLTNNVTGWGGGSTPVRATGATGFPRSTIAQYTTGTFMQTSVGAALPNDVCSVSLYIRPNGGTASGTFYFVWQRSSGGDDFSHTVATGTLPADTVSRLSFANLTAPANTTGLYILVDGINFGARPCDFTAVLLEKAATIGTFFDGDSPGGAWTGAAGNSTSTI